MALGTLGAMSETDDPLPATMDATLRLATDADVEGIRDLVHAAYRRYEPLIGRPPMPMLTDFAAAVRDHDVWLAEDGATLVAVLEVVAKEDHLWIDNVAVAPERQRRGLGRGLLAHAEAEARRLGFAELRLLTNERYLDNIAMYERHGYRETHRVPHLGTDLVHFRKVLDPASPRSRSSAP